jgi:hypothetical protein
MDAGVPPCRRTIERSEQKAVNLRGNPNVILTTGCNQWERGPYRVVAVDAVLGVKG